MSRLRQALTGLSPAMEKIRQLSGTAGLSIGVLQHNSIIHTADFGFRNIDAETAPNSHTIYRTASLTKFFTAAAMGILVHEGRLEFNSVVSKVLPEFKHADPEIEKHATVSDFLSHASGMATEDAMWYGDHNRTFIKSEEFVKTTTSLRRFYPVGKQFMYNNWGYGLADKIIEKVTGGSFGAFLHEKLIKPLGLERTFTAVDFDADNVAEAYLFSGSNTPYHVEQPQFGDGTSMAGATCIKSSIEDLLKFYQAFIHALKDQEKRGTTSTPGSPFKHLVTLTKPHIRTEGEGSLKSYAMGWFHNSLPGNLDVPISDNGALVREYPTIGTGLENPPQILFHASALLGFLGCAIVIPESEIAIVVLGNTLGLQDAPNWIGGLALETILDCPKKNDYVALATEAAASANKLFPDMFAQMEKDRIKNTPLQPLQKFVGRYFNSVKTWFFDIFQDESEALILSFCGERSQRYPLQHYHYDVLSWVLPYDEILEHQLWPIPDPGYYLLYFEGDSGDEDKFGRLIWKCSWGAPGGETYLREKST